MLLSFILMRCKHSLRACKLVSLLVGVIGGKEPSDNNGRIRKNTDQKNAVGNPCIHAKDIQKEVHSSKFSVVEIYCSNLRAPTDNFCYKIILDEGKKKEVHHCSLKEHLKISKTAKFGCQML